jgi:hypothetical protein
LFLLLRTERAAPEHQSAQGDVAGHPPAQWRRMAVMSRVVVSGGMKQM